MNKITFSKMKWLCVSSSQSLSLLYVYMRTLLYSFCHQNNKIKLAYLARGLMMKNAIMCFLIYFFHMIIKKIFQHYADNCRSLLVDMMVMKNFFLFQFATHIFQVTYFRLRCAQVYCFVKQEIFLPVCYILSIVPQTIKTFLPKKCSLLKCTFMYI